jgi:hypothetical protein
MFSGNASVAVAGNVPLAPPRIGELRVALDRLAAHDGGELTESEIVDHLAAMERLKSALAAAQARLAHTWVGRRTEREAAAGMPAARRGRGLGHEIGLARREGPVRGRQHLSLAMVLVDELPHTHAALTRGEISEWAATLVARETAVLSREHRAQVDRELADEFATAGERRLGNLARQIGYRLDPGSAIRRVRGAESDRRVGLRPAPDTMTYLTAHLPVAQGVACRASLMREADSRRAAGDQRTQGQIMADTLVERLTGQSRADGTPAAVDLVMSDRTLFQGDQEPAHLQGYGAVPAFLARRLVREADRAWVRRLYTSPTSGELVAMDSQSRTFDGALRHFLVLRDQLCRNTWCGAPIRHLDHLTPVADGGATTADNGQGLCEACNYAKEAPGWRVRRLPGAHHPVEVTTPTGHRHRSRAPDPPGTTRYPVQLDLVFASAS